MLSRLFLASCFTFSFANAADIRRYCLPATVPPEVAVPTFLRSAVDSQGTAHAQHELAQKREVRVRAESSLLDTMFVEDPLEPGDCLLVNWDERSEFDVRIDEESVRRKNRRPYNRKLDAARWKRPNGEQTLVPAILFRARDDSRHFGLANLEIASILALDRKHKETPASKVRDFRSPHGDMLVIYVFCPPRRDSTCRLSVRDGRKWIVDKKTGKRLEIPVLARSRTLASVDPAIGRRTTYGGDTPQGIYYLWATLFTEDKSFGRLPRIDLDAAYPPINAHPYELGSYALSELIPRDALNDYWALEWALAYKLGRLHLRIHANPELTDEKIAAGQTRGKDDLSQTQGCINAGKHMKLLLDTLVAAGALTRGQLERPESTESTTLGWRVSPRLGRAFLIVKDEEPAAKP